MNSEQLQKLTFKEHCYQKFKRGMLEHKDEDWDYEIIKPLYQLLDEYADAYNYTCLLEDKYPTLGNRHKKEIKKLWEEVKSHILIYKQ